MAIERVFIKNFKGIGDHGWLDLRPITVFIGANSSGKSSCLHALAALAQTVKLPNSTRPLILDDEYAQVHLGRFIDVVHSRRYSDEIELGVDLGQIVIPKPGEKGKPQIPVKGPATVRFAFKSTLRTQDVHLRSAKYQAAGETFEVTLEKRRGLVLKDVRGGKEVAVLSTGLLLNPALVDPIDSKLFFPLWFLNLQLETALKDTLYLGPFRQQPLRNYPTRGSSPAEVGAQGESAVTMLANEIIQRQKREHAAQVARWLEVLGVGKALKVKRVSTSDRFDVEVELADGESFSVPDLGYGVSQVLPVLVQCSFAPKGATLLFEQPEIHLHPNAARHLAQVFCETAKEKGARIVIETHSPDMISQLQIDVREGRIPAADVAIYLVKREDGASRIERLALEEDGEIYDNWRKGFTTET